MVAVQAGTVGTHLVARMAGKLPRRPFAACEAAHSRQAVAALAPLHAWRIPPRCRAFSPATRCDKCYAPAALTQTSLPASFLSLRPVTLHRLSSHMLRVSGGVRLRAWDSRAEGLDRACGSVAASASTHTSAAASARASALAARDGGRAGSRAGPISELAGGFAKGWPQAVLGVLVAAGLVVALAVAPPRAYARQVAAVEAAPATLEMKACQLPNLTGALSLSCWEARRRWQSGCRR